MNGLQNIVAEGLREFLTKEQLESIQHWTQDDWEYVTETALEEAIPDIEEVI